MFPKAQFHALPECRNRCQKPENQQHGCALAAVRGQLQAAIGFSVISVTSKKPLKSTTYAHVKRLHRLIPPWRPFTTNIHPAVKGRQKKTRQSPAYKGFHLIQSPFH
jgi:hypothetical protein